MTTTLLIVFPSGSTKEFDAMQRASAHSSKKDISHLYQAATPHDVSFFFDAEYCKTGDIDIILKAKSSQSRTLEIHVHSNARYYTGIPGEDLAKFQDKAVLEPNTGTKCLVYFSISSNVV